MIYVVGLGPGRKEEMTGRALAALERSDVILGYKTYIDMIRPIFWRFLLSSPCTMQPVFSPRKR